MSESMQAFHITQYGLPNTWILGSLPKPTVTKPDQVQIRVHAASINPIDIMGAKGAMKMLRTEPFPYKIGYDVSGVITAAGDGVKNFKVGDEVITRLPQEDKGAFSEYVVTTEFYLARKPANLSHEEAACIPLVGLTSYQAFGKAPGGREGIKGKTVFVPAALGGAGSHGIQIAKILGAKEVITSVSTSKLARAQKLFEGKADKIIDYRVSAPAEVIPKGSVDFVYDTTGGTLDYIPMVKPETGTIISIATTPSGDVMKGSLPSTPFYMVWLLNFLTRKYYNAAKKADVNYEFLFLAPNGEDLSVLSKWAEEGKLVPLVGEIVDFKGEGALEKLRDAAGRQASGAGAKDGGKIVFKIVGDA